MHNLLSNIRYSTTKLIILLLAIFFLIAISSIAYNYYRINDTYQKQAIASAEQTIGEINHVLDSFNADLSKLLDDAKNTPCNTLEYKLRQFIESQSLIRSVTILHDKKIYCSSYFEPNQINIDILKNHTRNELNLLRSKFLTQQISIITYYLKKGEWSGYVAIPAFRLINTLPNHNFKNHTYIIFNDGWLTTNSQILKNTPQSDSQWAILKSDKYPFKIAIDFSTVTWSEKTISSFIIIGAILLTLLALSLSYIILNIPKRNLQQAISKNELVPYYQLVVSAADQKWRGVEVLVRWQHPKKGLIMPNQFISLAENSKLIIPMTKMLMKKVAKNLSANINQLPKPFYVSFNIHASQLEGHNLIDDCKQFLSLFPLNSITLTLEIVESHFIDSSNNLQELLNEFNKIGVTIAMDDFGTGYSNFGYLQKYKIDHLKIDKLFVSRICNTPSETHLIETIISLAKKLNMDIVAEGVETVEQLHYLTRQGVEFIQGFLFSKPAPLNEMLVLLTKPIKRIKPPIINQLGTYKKTIKII